MIYLDHAATTPVPKAVADAMYTVLTEEFGNPSAQYPMGQEMHRRVDAWRAVIAGAVGCEAKQLYFTSCGTEGGQLGHPGRLLAEPPHRPSHRHHRRGTPRRSQLLPAAGAGGLGRSRGFCRTGTETSLPKRFSPPCGRTQHWCPS